MTVGGGNGPPKASVLSKMPTSLLLGSFDQMLPMPPAQPYDPIVGPRPVRRTCTPTPKPQPCDPPGRGPGAPFAKSIGWGVTGSPEARNNSRAPSGSRPPDRSIWATACRSSSVDPRPAAPDGKAGGFAHWPSGG